MIYWVTIKKNLMKKGKRTKCNIRVPRGKISCTLTWGLYFYIYIDLIVIMWEGRFKRGEVNTVLILAIPENIPYQPLNLYWYSSKMYPKKNHVVSACIGHIIGVSVGIDFLVGTIKFFFLNVKNLNFFF